MRNRSVPHTLTGNLKARKRQLEAELAKIPDEHARERLVQQIREIEATEQLNGWLSSNELKAPN